MKRTYKTAPLPFIGQKRNFLKLFSDVITENIDNEGEGWTIVDAFGGSGLLSHNAKRLLPKAKVIYNDFDNYKERVKNITKTNQLRRNLADILAQHPRGQKLDTALKDKVLNAIKASDYIDINTVSTWVLFSGQYAKSIEDLTKRTFYNRIRISNFDIADDYFDGLEIVHSHYYELLNKYKDTDRCLLILDPPYICTQQGMYANESYFGMVEFLRLMHQIKPPFIFFSSTRSEFMDYLDFAINNQQSCTETLKGYKYIEVTSHVNSTAKYTDNLVYKF